MPNISQYFNKETVQPNDIGTAAWAQAGMRIAETYSREANAVRGAGESLGNAADTIQRHVAVGEISKYTANMAQTQANLIDQWNNIAKNTDPNQLAPARQKFLDEVAQPTIDKMSSGFWAPQAQEFATEHSADILGHLSISTLADVNHAGSVALMQNFGQVRDASATMVNKDPSTLPMALSTLQKSITAMVQNSSVSADQAMTIKTTVLRESQGELVSSAISGAIDRNPAAGMAMLNDPSMTQYLSPQQQQQLDNYGRTITRFQESQARMAQVSGQLANIQNANAAWSSILTKVIDDPTGNPNWLSADVLHNPAFNNSPGIKLSALGVAQRLATGSLPTTSDSTTQTTLMNRALLPYGATGYLGSEELAHTLAAGKISKQDYYTIKSVQSAIANDPAQKAAIATFTNWSNAQKQFIAPGGTGQQLDAFSAWKSSATQSFLKGLAAGYSVQDMLYNQKSAHYIGGSVGTFSTIGSNLDFSAMGEAGTPSGVTPEMGVAIGAALGGSLDTGSAVGTDNSTTSDDSISNYYDSQGGQ